MVRRREGTGAADGWQSGDICVWQGPKGQDQDSQAKGQTRRTNLQCKVVSKESYWIELLNGVPRSCGTPFGDLRGGLCRLSEEN